MDLHIDITKYIAKLQELLTSKEDDKNWKGIFISIGCISLILFRQGGGALLKLHNLQCFR